MVTHALHAGARLSGGRGSVRAALALPIRAWLEWHDSSDGALEESCMEGYGVPQYWVMNGWIESAQI